MERRTAFTMIGATTGVLMCGSIAAVAIVNATASTAHPPTEAIVADAGAVSPGLPDALPIAAAGPSFVAGELPAVVIPEPVQPLAAPQLTAPQLTAPRPAASRSAQAPVRSGRSGAAAATPSASASATASRASSEPVAQPRSLTIAEAKGIVLAQVSGDVVSATATERGGYQAIAVTVQRADGSRVTGYVETSSGVVFDWVQTQAPAPAAAAAKPAAGNSSHDDDDDDDHEERESEHEDHESDEDD